MKYDQYGQVSTTTSELCELLYKNPEFDLSTVLVENPDEFNSAVTNLHVELPLLKHYQVVDMSVEEFDRKQQSNWHMPQEYKELDIAAWLLQQCKEEYELQRVGEELLLFQERDLFNLLRYLKYFVDTMRKHNVVWGVGRGSSVASYSLYLIGVHKVNSLYYDLPIEEFLK